MRACGAGCVRSALARVLAGRRCGGRQASGCAPGPPAELRGEPDRFGGVSVRVAPGGALGSLDAAAFGSRLRAALRQWRSEGRIAVWLHIPILQSRLIAPAASLGFRFHHAESDSATLTLWLGEGPSRLPGYATHQVGVAGAVFDESNRKILVVQDRNKARPPNHILKDLEKLWRPGSRCRGRLRQRAELHQNVSKAFFQLCDSRWKESSNMWKFPGGLSEPGEDIGDTAVREVFEETGIKAEFRSLLSIRQQHAPPGAFGKSDMYIICRLEPRSFSISCCPQECVRCEWMDLGDLASARDTTPVTSRVARLLLYGLREGFDKVDLAMEELPALHPGLFYKLYHKELPESYRTATGQQ